MPHARCCEYAPSHTSGLFAVVSSTIMSVMLVPRSEYVSSSSVSDSAASASHPPKAT